MLIGLLLVTIYWEIRLVIRLVYIYINTCSLILYVKWKGNFVTEPYRNQTSQRHPLTRTVLSLIKSFSGQYTCKVHITQTTLLSLFVDCWQSYWHLWSLLQTGESLLVLVALYLIFYWVNILINKYFNF